MLNHFDISNMLLMSVSQHMCVCEREREIKKSMVNEIYYPINVDSDSIMSFG